MTNLHLPIDPSACVGRGATWLVVLPDCVAASAAASRLSDIAQAPSVIRGGDGLIEGLPESTRMDETLADQILAGTGPLDLEPPMADLRYPTETPQEPVRVERHASGRPWLMGSWPADEVVIAGAGRNRVAVIGAGAGVPTQLAEAAAAVRDLDDLNRLAVRLTGSFHLIASIDGAVRVQGSLSGVRRVFRAAVGGVQIAADRADVLAAATGSGVDEERLVSCLLSPEAPYPFESEVIWRGVRALPEDCYLRLDTDGSAREVRWWTAPQPVLPLTEGARALREALAAAVETRARTGRQLSCDLSGGLDSTPICYLTAAALRERGRDLITVTTTTGDPADDDPAWADLAAQGIPNLRRLVIPAEALPMPYDRIAQLRAADDEPLLDPGDRGDHEVLARLLINEGSELHLTGLGGDELLLSSPSYLRRLLRKDPLRAAAHLRGYRALHRWPWSTTLRLLVGTQSYRDWLAASADAITAPPPLEDKTDGAPGRPYRLPPWATDAAVEIARSRIRAAATRVELLGSNLNQHDDIDGMRMAGREMRRVNLLYTRLGLPLEAPYLDDRVVEACLAVNPAERTTPWQFKPLITEAMRGVLPDASLTRTTKADGSGLHLAGLRTHRADLLALCEDSILAKLGLVDTDKLRAFCTGMWTSPMWPVALTRTIGCERWLRDLTSTGLETTSVR